MKALALVEAPDHVCGRYRIEAFAPALARDGWAITVESLRSGPLARAAQLRKASRFDAVILQRKLLPRWQFAILRRSCSRLIFDYDDAVLYRDSYDPRGPICRRRAERFGRMARHADFLIAGNDFLADCAINAGAKADRVRVIPTCIDTTCYEPASYHPKEKLTLVWVGSSSTLRGLELQKPLFERLGREIPGLTLRIVADRTLELDSMPVEFLPWSEATEAAVIASADVGISWIPDDLWSRGKCGLKVLQYMAAGLPVVANSVGVHPRMITEGETGFLANTAESWIQAIKTLRHNPLLRQSLGRQARMRVEADYSLFSWSNAFSAAVSGSGAIPSAPLRVGPSIARKAEPR